MNRALCLLAAFLFAASCALAQAGGSTAKATLPHDGHEGLIVSADSYDDPARAKEKFGKVNPLPVGILPVEVFLRNDTTQAMRLDMSTIQLTLHFSNGRQQSIDWLDLVDVASIVAHPKGQPGPKSRRFPIGPPSAVDSKTERVKEQLLPFALDVNIVPPMATIHGFLFFDIGGDTSLVNRASLYVPDVLSMPANKPLMFFEVSLGGASSP